MPYAYFNNGLSLRAVDADYVADVGEVIAEDILSREEVSNLFPAFSENDLHQKTVLEISALESSVTMRRLREATLTDAGKAWLQDVEARIAALRLRLIG